jgi:RNA polymerase sigma factor (sigma-70 family)
VGRTTAPRDATAGPGLTAPREAHGDLLGAAWREGVAAHPGLALSEAAFREEATARAEAGEASREARADRLARMLRLAGGADLLLAFACERGVPGAWERLAEAYGRRLARALTAQGVPAGEADAIAADVPGDLVQPPRDGGARTRIGLWRGLSSLFSFLATGALRRWTNRLRGTRPESLDVVPASGPRPEPASREAGPAETAAGREEAARLDAALDRAWGSLTPREALVLLHRHRDGLPQKTIAAMLGVGEPRVSQLLSRGVERLAEALAGEGGGRPSPDAWEALRTALERRLATRAALPPPTGAGGRAGEVLPGLSP